VDLDNVAIRVLQEDLIPTGDRPAAIVGIADAQLVAPTHETLDVVSAETKVAMPHRIDGLLHLEAGIQVALGPMELDVAIREEVYLARIGAIVAFSTDYGMLIVGNGTQLEQIFIKIGQSGEIVGAKIHVVEFELHFPDSFMTFLLFDRSKFQVSDVPDRIPVSQITGRVCFDLEAGTAKQPQVWGQTRAN
jgi:hypothetical protein